MVESPLILKRIAADSILALGFKVLAVPLVYFVNLAMARLYGAGNMGSYYIALNLLTTIATMCCLGLNTGILRFTAAFRAEGELGQLRSLLLPALAIVTGLSCLAATVIYFAESWLASHFNAPDLPLVLDFMVWGLPIFAASLVLMEAVRAQGGVRWVIVQQMLNPSSFLILLIILSLAGSSFLSGSEALGLVYFISVSLGLAFLALWPGSYLSHQKPVIRTASLKDLLWYSWPLFLSSILWLVFGGIDSLILGLFSRPEEVAYYNIATRTTPLVTLPLIAINMVVPPLFAQFYQMGDLRGLEMMSQATARWMYFVALPLALLTILMAPELLGFFGPDFTKAQFALRVLAIGQLINVASGSVGFILSMTGNQKALFTSLVTAAAVVIPLMAFSALTFGLNGLALVSALGAAGINVLMAWAVWRRLKIKAFAQRVGWANLGGLLGVGLFYLVAHYLGPFWGMAFFSLGYLGLTAKTLKAELLLILEKSAGWSR